MRIFYMPILFSFTLLTSCAEENIEHGLYDHHLRYPFSVGIETRKMAIDRFDAQTKNQLAMLATDIRDRSAGLVEISRHHDLSTQIADLLVENGVGTDRILILPTSSATPDGMVMITAPLYKVDLPDCSAARAGERGWSSSNADSANFGCSVRRNIGAMAVNPRDLVQIRQASDHDINRSVEVIRKYRAGQATGSAAEAGGNASISNTIGKTQ